MKPIAILPFDRQYRTNQTCGTQLPIFGPNDTVVFTYCITRLKDGSDGPAFLDEWNLATHRRTVSAHPLGMRGANALGLTSGGQIVVVGTNRALVLDARTLRPLRQVPLSESVVAYGSTALSTNGRTLATAEASGAVRLVDLRNGQVRVLEGNGGLVESLAFSPDGRELAIGDQDGTVLVWDVDSGAIVDRLDGHATRVLGLAFSSDGKTLYTCSLDGAIFVWDLGTARRFGLPFGTSTGPQYTVGPDEQTIAPPLAVSPDGRRFAYRVGRTRVGIFATATANPVAAFDVTTGDDIGALAWSRTGLLAVSGGNGHVQLWDVSGRPRFLRSLHGMGSINGERESVTALAFSPDGTLLAAGDVNHTPYTVVWRYGTTAVWDAASGRLLWSVRSRRGWVNTVTFAPDGKTLAAANETNTLVIYRSRSGRVIGTMHGEGVFGYMSAAFAPDGTIATGTWAGIVQLWNPSSGREIGKPTQVAAAPVSSIAFSPSGSTFATTGGSDGIAKLWSTSTLQQFGSNLPGSGPWWGNARFAPDGSRLVVVWQDTTGSVWPTSSTALENHACTVAGRNFTRAEWRQLVGGPYRITCPGQPGVSGS